ncbi:Tm-1-like ATP-binding domain-containing protein [Agromyces sp. GXQ0307]|uniref:Tm-1-like ATP-binding domain-containing protein n=1 Tax=Agromyces sp. GXQ0307 TaxID=3377835 RepID=UPI00383B1BBA
MPTVALLGTLDTKADEYAFVAEALAELEVTPYLIDVGVRGSSPTVAAVSNGAVAGAIGMTIEDVRAEPDRGTAISRMAQGATAVVTRLVEAGEIDGILALGGTGGTTLASQVMRALPVGFPKLIVSTVASGDTRQYVGSTDITMMYSIVDIAGINAISARILTNAAGAIAGMAHATVPAIRTRPVIAATMFGLTTPAVTAARQVLEEHGYEVLVFHATGAGGDSMEAIIDAGLTVGVLDITTTELADELVGGVFAAGPRRLTAPARAGVPHLVSAGALDMVNFGAPDTVPEEYRTRTLYHHNDSVTLMRTSPEESTEIARRMAARLNAREDRSTTMVFLPEAGFSGIDVESGPFFDPVADRAFIDTLVDELHDDIAVVRRDVPVNDEDFARAMANALHEAIASQEKGGTR